MNCSVLLQNTVNDVTGRLSLPFSPKRFLSTLLNITGCLLHLSNSSRQGDCLSCNQIYAHLTDRVKNILCIKKNTYSRKIFSVKKKQEYWERQIYSTPEGNVALVLLWKLFSNAIVPVSAIFTSYKWWNYVLLSSYTSQASV